MSHSIESLKPIVIGLEDNGLWHLLSLLCEEFSKRKIPGLTFTYKPDKEPSNDND